MTPPDDLDKIPKLTRGRFLSGIGGVELVRIGAVAVVLVFVIIAGRPCADGMATFVESFAPPPDAAPPPPNLEYHRLTEDEIRRQFGDWEDAGARQPAATDSGTAAKATGPDPGPATNSTGPGAAQ